MNSHMAGRQLLPSTQHGARKSGQWLHHRPAKHGQAQPATRPHSPAVPAFWQGPAAPSTRTGPEIEIEPGPFNSRKIRAAVTIRAPMQSVWRALTAYDSLGKFIPGLTVNKCLERWDGGCKLLQVGETDIIVGLKFSARCVLQVEEHPRGIPDEWRSSEIIVSLDSRRSGGGRSSGGTPGNGAGAGARSNSGYSSGSSSSWSSDEGTGDAWACGSCHDISFQLLEGDFQVFKGLWRIQPGSGPATTLLSYSLFVRPQVWLPVALVERRIEKEVVANLTAVRKHVEGQLRAGAVARGAQENGS